jgi:prepilin-type N-terminal cleavage/methylation domain-containing protein
MQAIMEKSVNKMRRRRKLGNKGFSLVELIIVIAIMAALVAILAPNLIRYVQSSRQSADLASFSAIDTAFRAAVIEHQAIGATYDTIEVRWQPIAAGGLRAGQIEIRTTATAPTVAETVATTVTVANVNTNPRRVFASVAEAIGASWFDGTGNPTAPAADGAGGIVVVAPRAALTSTSVARITVTYTVATGRFTTVLNARTAGEVSAGPLWSGLTEMGATFAGPPA